MVLYFGQSVTASSSGSTIAGVTCDKCQSDYYYEMTRIGTSSGHSPYGIALSSIEETVKERSRDELVSRLHAEAELVPCPNCHWINDELVRGFRLGRYRGLGLAAVLVAIVGVVMSIIASLFVYLGPQADRWCLPYLLVGGPLLSMIAGSLIIALQRVLRLRIRPNADYPLPPKLPAGTPPALVLNATNEELVPITPQNESRSAFNEWQEFQLGRDTLPENCCECLSENAVATACEWHFSGMALRLAHCSECHRRSRIKHLTVCLAAMITLSGLAYVSLRLFRFEAETFWILFVVAVMIAFAIASWTATLATSPASASVADASRGIIRIKFRSAEFATLIGNDGRPCGIHNNGDCQIIKP